MREEAPGRDVECVDARLFEPFAHLDRFFGAVAGRTDTEEGHGVVVLLHADLHLQVEIVADFLADRPDDLEDEPRAILQLAAVAVFAIVDGRTEELRDQVAVGAVQLDAVEVRLPGAPRPLREGVHDFLDLLFGHPLALEPVHRVWTIGGAQARRVLDAGDVALTATVTELQDESAVVLMDRFTHLAPEGDVTIVIDHRVVGDDAAAEMDGDERRNDRADAAFGEFRFPVDARLTAGAVVVVEAARNVRADDAVLDGEIAELEWLKDRVETHAAPPR
jgi:hypothetical protein